MRLYTVEEARALLPEVIPVVEALRDAFVELRALQATVAAGKRGASGDGNLLANPWEKDPENHAHALNTSARAAVERLAEWGVEVKDPERGLIDFYSRRDGEVVYLCYLLGEPDVTWWHTLGGGFAGRQRLEGGAG
jgi:hypothetical protein